MGIRVDIPILIRTDPSSLEDAPDAVVASVREAFSRALVRSRAEVLDGIGGYRSVALAQPEVRWTGRDSRHVPLDRRTRFRAALAEMVFDEANAVGLFAHIDASAGLPDPLSELVSERLDESRLNRPLGLYRIPSFDGGSAWLYVDYHSFPEQHGFAISWGTPLTLHHQLKRRLPTVELLQGNYPEFKAIPDGGAFGFIGLSDQSNKGSPTWVIIFSTDGAKSWKNFSFHDVGGFDPATDGELKPIPAPPPLGNAVATWIPKPQTPQEGLVLVNRVFGAALRQAVTSKIDHLDHQVKFDDRHEAINRTVGLYLNKIWDDVNKADALLSVEFAGRSMLLKMSAANESQKWNGDAHLLPLYRLDRADGGAVKSKAGRGEGGSKQGKEGGKSQGRSGPGEGGEEAGGKPYYPKAKLDLFFDRLTCEPFEDELKIDDLPGTSGIKSLMETIAFRLQIDYCSYAGNFCIGAASAVSARARGVGQHAAEDASAAYYTDPARAGNLGILQFLPTVSPAIRTMRYLAETCAMLDELHTEIGRYARAHRTDLFPYGQQYGYDKSPEGWCRRLLEEYHSAISDSVADIFKMTCRILMLQMLKSSKEAIQHRLDKFREYLPFFQLLMITMFQRDGELDSMRDKLRSHIALRSIPGKTDASSTGAQEAWTAASGALVNLLEANKSLSALMGKEGAFVTEGGVTKIVDSVGVAWSVEEIEVARVFARGQAEDIDPLVKQLGDIPDLMEEFRTDPGSLGYTLYTTLLEMRSNNEEQAGLVREDWQHAFKASPIIENTPTATVVGSKVVLGGIHLEAHKQIGEFFRGHSCYPEGLNAAFDAELGKRSLKHAVELSGTVALSIMCPPVGLGFGVASSIVEIRNAYRQKRLYGSFINPDLIISQAQVELELYVAWLGAILNVLPEVGSFVLKPFAPAIRNFVGEGLGAELKATEQEWLAAEKYMMRNVAEEAAEAVAGQFIDQFATALVSAAVIEQVFSEVVSPIANYAMEQLELSSSVGGSAGARAFMERVIQRYEQESEEPMTW